MHAEVRRPFLWMTVFFVAMAFLESAVVVYLRALYYPEGFAFPLVPMDPAVVRTEVWREVATLIMLLAPAALVARSALERFAWFCYGFGIWDLFYYIWLKVLLDWPPRPETPDLLFLLPVPWVGPVWAPVVVAVGLIAFAIVLLRGLARRPIGLLDGGTWAMLSAGALLIILSFTIDPLLRSYGVQDLMDTGKLVGDPLLALEQGQEPVGGMFRVIWFMAGCVMAFGGLYRCHRRAC